MYLLRDFVHMLELLKSVLCLLAFGKCNDTVKIVMSCTKGLKNFQKMDPVSFAHLAIPLKQVVLRWLIKQGQRLVHQRSELSLACSYFHDVKQRKSFPLASFLFHFYPSLLTPFTLVSAPQIETWQVMVF